MAQPIQIVPKFKFPHVETVINDYTVVNEIDATSATSTPVVRYVFPFVSAKGIDNRLILKSTRKSIVDAYGESNFKKFGQPLMQALNVASIPNTQVWCMRVMPENATYSNNCISLYYKGDTETDVAEASKRKFRIKFVQKTLANSTKIEDLIDASKKLDGASAAGVYIDAEGYTQVPGAILMYCAGRGKYGDSYRLRMTQDTIYEKDYGIKFYDFEVLNSSSGLKHDTTYVGCVSTSPKYSSTTLINDVLEDQDDGVVPMYIRVDEDGIEDAYNAFCTWVAGLEEDLNTELESKLAKYAIPDGMIENEIPVTAEYADKVAEILSIKEKIAYANSLPSLDEFDVIFGRRVATTATIPFLQYPAKLTDDIDTASDDYNPLDYTLSDVVFFDNATGVRMSGGDDGYFANPRVETSLDADGNEVNIKWTREREIEECYKNAFSGVYDARILTPRRIPANAIWDANYPMSVKSIMADLAITVRKDAICYLDAGIRSSFGSSELTQLINDFSVFADISISKNVQQYTTREPSTNKRVVVTITYLLSQLYADHVLNNGVHIPFVKENCRLTGHVRDSLHPTVEDYEQELKEVLNENRFNYFETVGMDDYQRATQNTAQSYNSDLLEESNVATMFDAKRIIEDDINARLYDFTNATIRSEFRQYELAKFNDWIGSRCQSLDIEFAMSDWEEKRSILHCYLRIVFRGIQKRGILEIDINPRESSSTPVSASTN